MPAVSLVLGVSLEAQSPAMNFLALAPLSECFLSLSFNASLTPGRIFVTQICVVVLSACTLLCWGVARQ